MMKKFNAFLGQPSKKGDIKMEKLMMIGAAGLAVVGLTAVALRSVGNE